MLQSIRQTLISYHLTQYLSLLIIIKKVSHNRIVKTRIKTLKSHYGGEGRAVRENPYLLGLLLRTEVKSKCLGNLGVTGFITSTSFSKTDIHACSNL